MTGQGEQAGWRRILFYWGPVAGYAGLIFYLSAQSHPDEDLPSLFGSINDKVTFEEMASYIYFTETLSNLDKKKVKGNFIGECNGTEYYLLFKKKGETIDFIIEPFYRYWNIKDSKYTTDPGGTTWIEPKNNSKEFGINLAVEY